MIFYMASKNMHMVILTRGCPRKCPFCMLRKKEGKTSVLKLLILSQFWRGQKHIKLLDPNLFGGS